MAGERARRIVVKLGTGVLTGGGATLSNRAMLEIVRQAAALHDGGHRVVLVSSGAVAAGREALGSAAPARRGRSSVPVKQMLASVGQVRLMQRWAELFGLFDLAVGQVLLTRGDIDRRAGYLNARDTLQTLLDHRIVPIVNENDTIATDEIRVGDNDNLSALVANLIDADLLVILSDIDGLYTADPRHDPQARRLDTVAVIDESVLALAGGSSTGHGTGGMVTKLQAARLAAQAGIVTVLAKGDLADVLVRIVAGESVGTTFSATGTRRESRRRRLLAESPAGTVTVDAGAAARLRAGRASLLPVGVTAADGGFERGAVVRMVAPDGSSIGIGIANYDAADLARLVGAPSTQIEARLGYTYGDEAIHRDTMVLTTV